MLRHTQALSFHLISFSPSTKNNIIPNAGRIIYNEITDQIGPQELAFNSKNNIELNNKKRTEINTELAYHTLVMRF